MYIGIAISGQKGNGKDVIADYIRATRRNVVILRSKTPIVEAFEEARGLTYDKARDDSALIEFSRGLRMEDPLVVARWLGRKIRQSAHKGLFPVVPDMRFHDENAVCHENGMLMIKVEAAESVRKDRIIARDGSLDNYKPDSETERHIDDLQYQYVIDNNRPDNGKFAIYQLESYLSRLGSLFTRDTSENRAMVGDRVRVVNPQSAFFFDTGILSSVVHAGYTNVDFQITMDEDAGVRSFELCDFIGLAA